MADEPTDYDCLTCGACCASISPGETYVLLDETDVERLHGTGLPIVRVDVQDADPPERIPALPTKRDPHGTKVCAALGGCAGGVNACSVYPQRPGVCRTFAVGSLFCQEARRRFGLPV
ncbi:MAG: YkgJ family cysteine cluster protein [Gemmataceae bacterium]|nr:YkgJ family cysteine cluster protein [Gemmataceae bacterium]